MDNVIVGGKALSLRDFEKIVLDKSKISIDPQAMKKVGASFTFLKSYAADKVIYGINTGLGPMAQFKISEEDHYQLQYNLIRSHCSGAGNIFTEELARATTLARLNCFVQGYSGIHPDTISVMIEFLNQGISPCIFEKGGVGASGDLVQLAHLALNLIGEGEVLFEGKLQPAEAVLERLSIAPVRVHLREGLALVNGTSAMTGVGLLNILMAKKLLYCATALSSMTNELMKSFDDHFSLELNEAKHHDGQRKIAAGMRAILNDSKLVRKRSDHLYHKKIEEAVFTDKVQEYYSLRCVPQVLGPVYDTLSYAENVLINEINSVNDNPVIDHEQNNVFHGGNFHGDYVALEMDKVKTVITKLSMLSERQLNYLLNDRLNQKLPPFINLGKFGFNFGMQGIQFTATSTTAENQTLSYPMYLHSISNNNDNQDIVSMGCNAALMTRRVIENTFDVLAIHAVALAQAVDFLKCQTRLSSITLKLYEELRAIVPVFIDDQPKYKELQGVRKYLTSLEPSLIL